MKKIVLFAFILVQLCVLTQACAKKEENKKTVIVAGKVTDGATDKALSGVKVELGYWGCKPAIIETDDKGYYKLSFIFDISIFEQQSVYIRFTKKGWRSGDTDYILKKISSDNPKTIVFIQNYLLLDSSKY